MFCYCVFCSSVRWATEPDDKDIRWCRCRNSAAGGGRYHTVLILARVIIIVMTSNMSKRERGCTTRSGQQFFQLGLELIIQRATPGPCPVSQRLAKQLSRKKAALFGLTGQPVSGKFYLANRSLSGRGAGDIYHYATDYNWYHLLNYEVILIS